MNKDQILQLIKNLAKSQGFYERFYENIKDNEFALEYLERQNFKDQVDFVLFIENL